MGWACTEADAGLVGRHKVRIITISLDVYLVGSEITAFLERVQPLATASLRGGYCKPFSRIQSSSEKLWIGFVSSSGCLFSESASHSHHLLPSSRVIVCSSKRYRSNLAGTPATIAYGGTSFVTTAPA